MPSDDTNTSPTPLGYTAGNRIEYAVGTSDPDTVEIEQVIPDVLVRPSLGFTPSLLQGISDTVAELDAAGYGRNSFAGHLERAFGQSSGDHVVPAPLPASPARRLLRLKYQRNGAERALLVIESDILTLQEKLALAQASRQDNLKNIQEIDAEIKELEPSPVMPNETPSTGRPLTLGEL